MPGIELGNIAIVAASDIDLQMGNFFLRPTGATGRRRAWLAFVSALSARSRRQTTCARMAFATTRPRSWATRCRRLLATTTSTTSPCATAGDWNGFKIATGSGYYIDMDEGALRRDECDHTAAASCFTTS